MATLVVPPASHGGGPAGRTTEDSGLERLIAMTRWLTRSILTVFSVGLLVTSLDADEERPAACAIAELGEGFASDELEPNLAAALVWLQCLRDSVTDEQIDVKKLDRKVRRLKGRLWIRKDENDFSNIVKLPTSLTDRVKLI